MGGKEQVQKQEENVDVGEKKRWGKSGREKNG
jgi:hypothetical protein